MSNIVDLTHLPVVTTSLEIQEYNPQPRYLSETPVATVWRYLKSWWTPASQPDTGSLVGRPIDTDPLKTRQTALETRRKQASDINDNTIFYRTTSDKVGHLGAKRDVDVIIGVVDGKFTYKISDENLRSTAKGAALQGTFTAGLAVASAASYYLTGQGVMTKALITAFFSTIVPQLAKIKYLPQIAVPLVSAVLTFVATKLVADNVFVQFTFVAGIGLCAILYKRGGKALATGGWDNFKKYVIPMGVTETRVKSLLRQVDSSDPQVQYSQKHQLVERIPLIPQDEDSNQAATPLFLEFTIYDQDMYYALVIDDSKNEVKFPPTKMASKSGDDDDDDDDDKKVKTVSVDASNPSKKAKKKDGKSKKEGGGLAKTIKKATLIIGSGILTGVSKFFTGEGLTTLALNTIFTASVKAEVRTMAFVNGYGILLLASGAALAVKFLAPESYIGDLYFIPLSTLVGIGTKDYKDRIVTGKAPKNTDIISVPVAVQRLALKMGWTPTPVADSTLPMQQVLEKGNKDKVTVKLNAKAISPVNPVKQISAKLKISSRSITGVYELNKTEQTELRLGKLKAAKLGKVPEVIFITSAIGLTLLSSFLTKQVAISSGATTIEAQNMGEGVITGIFNSVLSTFLKQTGRKLPPIPRDGGLLLTSIGAIALERYLISIDSLPMLFSSIATSGFLAIQSKKAKQWVFDKEFGKTEGWITTKHPTTKEMKNQWNALKGQATRCFTCLKDQLPALIGHVDDESMILMKQGATSEYVELLVIPRAQEAIEE